MSIYIDTEYADITLVVGGEEFKLHSNIMKSNCEYFRAAINFRGLVDAAAPQSTRLVIDDYSAAAARYVIDVIYGIVSTFTSATLWLESINLAHYLGCRCIDKIVDAKVVSVIDFSEAMRVLFRLRLPAMLVPAGILAKPKWEQAVIDATMQSSDIAEITWVTKNIYSNESLSKKSRSSMVAKIIAGVIGRFSEPSDTQKLLRYCDPMAFTVGQMHIILAAKLDPTTYNFLRCLPAFRTVKN
ncbi:MAG: BTB/POZ domain-containing protein [Castellaniella sp.]